MELLARTEKQQQRLFVLTQQYRQMGLVKAFNFESLQIFKSATLRPGMCIQSMLNANPRQ